MSTTLIAFIIGAVGVVGLILVARSWGVKAERSKQIKSRFAAMKTAKEIQNEVEALPDAARRDELGRWVRKAR